MTLAAEPPIGARFIVTDLMSVRRLESAMTAVTVPAVMPSEGMPVDGVKVTLDTVGAMSFSKQYILLSLEPKKTLLLTMAGDDSTVPPVV